MEEEIRKHTIHLTDDETIVLNNILQTSDWELPNVIKQLEAALDEPKHQKEEGSRL